MDSSAKLTAGVDAYLAGRHAEAEAIATDLLKTEPANFRAFNLAGMAAFQQGRLDDGLQRVVKATELGQDYAAAFNNLATLYRARGDHAAALASIERAIQIEPGSDYFLVRAALLLDDGAFEQAAADFNRCITIDAACGDAYAGLADALSCLGRYADALANYERALALNIRSAEIYNSRGNALRNLQQAAQALDSYDRALAARPQYAEAYNNRGNVLRDLRRPAEALASYERALELNAEYPEALNNRGSVLGELNRPREALESFARALVARDGYAEAYNNRGILYSELRRHAEALEEFDAALAINPDYADALSNRGNSLRELKRYDAALASFDRAIELKPDFPQALYSRGHTLRDLRRYSTAVASYAQLVKTMPDYPFAKGHLLHAKMLCCDWSGLDAITSAVQADIRAGRKSAEPFGYQGIADSVADLRACAEIYAAEMYPSLHLPAPSPNRKSKIRIGYLAGEFRQQATSVLMAEVWERHDKTRFEIFAFDNGWDDGSDMRARLNSAFEEIVDISKMSDLETCDEIRRRGIDILINLNGYFGLQRQGVFSRRPCPVQVNYLGFPGTLGADYIDYIIADKWVIPPDEHGAYAEKVVYLPDSYQANDTRRAISQSEVDRAACHLPAAGFVFCCFNNNYKITPEIFGRWMRLLNKVEGSVLWLLEDNADAARNLREEAMRCGVAAERLVFAPRMPTEDHLARHRLADLFLDTLPYNAHTTASDALWAGLPLLTCRGTTFPGRVATSLLNAAGLPELVTDSLEQYEQRALQLAMEPELLEKLRLRLACNRESAALFDAKRYCRHLEGAYKSMWQRSLDLLPAASFAVPAVTD